MYRKGDGVPVDEEEAARWRECAIALGADPDKEAQPETAQ